VRQGGVDDGDKAASFVGNATLRRSTSLLDDMPRILLWLSRKPSLLIFVMAWTCLLVGAILSNDRQPWLARMIGTVAIAAVTFGYPFLIIFGFPAFYSGKASRLASLLALLVIAGAYIASANGPTIAHDTSPAWLLTLLGGALAGLIFSPFIVATHVLGKARRELEVYKAFDSIGMWLALLCFAFGGVFFVRRSVLSAAESVIALDGSRI
jgi:hypothetical protein